MKRIKRTHRRQSNLPTPQTCTSVFLDFLGDDLDRCRNSSEFEHVLTLASIAWNGGFLDQFREISAVEQALARYQIADSNILWVRRMASRRVEQFGNHHWMASPSCEEVEGGMNLAVTPFRGPVSPRSQRRPRRASLESAKTSSIQGSQ